MIKILHIEDDRELSELLALFFKDKMQVDNLSGSKTLLSLIKNSDADIFIVDINLRAYDGISLCQGIRTFSSIPILVATDKDDIESKIKSFEYGVNDFISKPFDPRELEIRINMLCSKKTSKKVEIEFDEPAHSLKIDARPVVLTLLEFEIFALLYTNKGSTISRYDILNTLDDIGHSDTSEDTLNVLIGRLRKKIDKFSNKSSFIKTKRGIGYYFEE